MIFLVSDAMPKYARYKIQLPQYNWHENSFRFSWKTLKNKIEFHFIFRTTVKMDKRFVATTSLTLLSMVFPSLALPDQSLIPRPLGLAKRQFSFTHLQ